MPTREVGVSAHTRYSVMPMRNSDLKSLGTHHVPGKTLAQASSVMSKPAFTTGHVPPHLETWWSSGQDSTLPAQAAQVQFLVRELRDHMPRPWSKKKKHNIKRCANQVATHQGGSEL